MDKQKKINQLSKFAEYLSTHGFIDTIDVSAEISLCEYGLMRNPKTGKVIYSIPIESTHEIQLDWTIVNLEDAQEFLEEAPDGFFSFISSNKKTELKNLSADFLSNIILSANMYNGWFEQSCTWDNDIESLKTNL